jgi:hypothetical protein
MLHVSDQGSAIKPDVLLTALEYLLDVRQSQLAEALSEAAHRGDSQWTHRLRSEVDETSRFLQALRNRMEQGLPPSIHQDGAKELDG